VATSIELTTVVCPDCGRERSVSARTARRGAGRCRWCLAGDGRVEPPDDRAFWLGRFTDEAIAEMALHMFGRRPDQARIRRERERLLGLVAPLPLREMRSGLEEFVVRRALDYVLSRTT
jgi:hypothetical protein